ncbi:hypothetical protein HRG_004681 [Hirsutella rhossiliensis]|uniref:Uncharacterized protein n=1 Tax=Hirsutella rhossiliensis TaxID=111463 RepID=A0A9P8MXP9_9HYPO|nr:uncharacterized protein HRG_04681 [Hirsutella rhossiliensis]KAH0964253.1 hypothetical protein HRG_04681 [Hirsutella rhossiliensis]
MCSRVIDMVFCREVSSSVRASPLAATALLTAASVRAGLWTDHGSGIGGGLSMVASTGPKKGGEAQQLIGEYRRHHADSKKSAAPMVLRDFYASIFSWQFIRCPDWRTADLCGSALCMTTAIDYVGTRDDAGGGGYDVYMAAASEGVACLAGKAANQALRDLTIADSFMVAKDEMTERAMEILDVDEFIRVSGGPVTPSEFLRARWWDAAMVPYHRLIMSTDGYRHLTNSLGTFSSVHACGRIKRAIDSLIRYNEMVDVVSDYSNHECFNELLVALAVDGSSGAHGYAHAVARVTDDVLACGCGVDGHEEAAELAMGGCVWYLLVPRYIARKQLFSYENAVEDVVREAYAWPAPGTRLRAVADVSLQGGETLHTESWQPLWGGTDAWSPDAHQPAVISGLASRIVRRSLVAGPGLDAMHGFEAAARSALADCDRAAGQEGLGASSAKWCHLLETLLESVSAGGPVTRTLSCLFDRIWRHTIVGLNHDLPDSADGADERLFIDVDRAIRQTYLLPSARGAAVRRVFFGVTSGAVELSGLSPYARLCAGAARMQSLRDTHFSDPVWHEAAGSDDA